jgi:predicted nucleotidyltransferase
MEIKQLKIILMDVLTGLPEIRLVYLFGSRVEGDVGPMSDYDFAVLHGGTLSFDEVTARFSHSLTKELKHRIDVVSLNDSPVELAFSIVSHGVLLYERDVATRVEFESRVMGLYFDRLPVLRENRREIVSGGDHAARVQRYREAFGRTARTLSQIGTAQG